MARPIQKIVLRTLSPRSLSSLTLLEESHPEKRTGAFHVPAKAEWPSDTRLAEDLFAACGFQFEFGKLRFPAYRSNDGRTPRAMLRRLTATRKVQGPPQQSRAARQCAIL